LDLLAISIICNFNF